MNYNAQVTAEKAIPCSDEDYQELAASVEADASGLETQRDTDGEVYLYADESIALDLISDKTIEKLAEILRKANEPYLEFGMGFYGSRPASGAAGGGSFRIHSDGSWEDQEKRWPLSQPKDTGTKVAVLSEPIGTIEKLKELADGDGRLSVNVAVDLTDLIQNDIEGLNDLMDELVLGQDFEYGTLADIYYGVVDHQVVDDSDSVVYGKAVINVNADISEIIKEYEDRDED